MKLKEIKVNSFKSIIKQNIRIENNCIGFIGLNESGKSNILKAIKFLDPKNKLTIKDKCKMCKDLPAIEFLLSITLTRTQKEKLLVNLNEELFQENYNYEFSLIKNIEINSILIKNELINLENAFKSEFSLIPKFELTLNNEFMQLNENNEIPPSEIITINETQIPLKTANVIHIDLVPDQYKAFYESLRQEYITEKIMDYIVGYLIDLVPSVEFWEYDSRYLIPAEITYSDFIKDDNAYENNSPLYNMFKISTDLEIIDIDDLKKKIEEWKVDSGARRRDAKILSRDINKHIKNIWEDYDQALTIELEENKITIHVSDPKSTKMNFYDMSVRSQGFKTFISFILTISAEVKTGTLENYVLILDEPETHLHPSGVKYMKNELLKLAYDNNYVFFATHSIFMIDRKNLARHIIVQKNKEETSFIKVTRNNILQEEVIYQALGTSRDEFSVSQKNILFEGELDVEIFAFFLNNCIKKTENKLSDFEFLDGGGTTRIYRYFKEKSVPNDSEWIFILDMDAPGRKLPAKIEQVTINEVFKNMKFHYYSKEKDFELEDLLPLKIIEQSFNESQKKYFDDEKQPLNLNNKSPIGSQINKYYGINRVNNSTKKQIEEAFKENLDCSVNSILDLINKEKNINAKLKKFSMELPVYFDFITNFLNKLFDMEFEKLA